MKRHVHVILGYKCYSALCGQHGLEAVPVVKIADM